MLSGFISFSENQGHEKEMSKAACRTRIEKQKDVEKTTKKTRKR
jgi:hypothetical protein